MTWGDISRLLNDLLGSDPKRSVSANVGRKAAEGRRLYIALEAIINVPFALLGERHHCATQAAREANL